MSKYYIGKLAMDLKTVQVFCYTDVPTTKNQANILYTDALMSSKGGADNITSTKADLPADELAKIKAGKINETLETFRFSSIHLTDNQRIAEIETWYKKEESGMIKGIETDLRYYNKDVDISIGS